MIDRFGKEIDFSELFMEETLSAKDKKNIPDDQWGLIIKNDKGEIVERKFPLNDETHVRQAAIFFDRAKGLSDDQKRELARNIVRRAKELDIDYSGWESLKPYLDKPVKEQYMTYEWLMKQNYPDPDSTSGTSDFDDPDKEPDDCYCEQTEIPKKFKKILEGIYESVNSKFFPNQFDDYSSSMHFRDELKNFIRLAEPLVTKKGVPFHIESLYYLWKMAKASIDSSAYKEYVEKHKYNIEDYDKSIRDYERRIENYGGSKRNGQSLESLKNARDNVVKLKELNIKYYDWGKNKASVTSSVYQILQEKHFSESFEEMFGPVIQEAFDAVTGEEIPIDKAYSLEEMKERTYTEEELKKSKREIKDYLKFANDIVKRIKVQVEKDSKEPTGNQNCLLCTWCAEIGFRGVNKNPRPVYSPCDPIFKVHGENIVRDPMKIIPRGYDNLLEHLADVSQPFARFYVHVNWKGSRGGHEFLLLKVIDDECYIVDAQAGRVDKLSDTHKYFTDINWENSYLCRLDNKNFNRKLFDTMNDPKMTLPWDPKRDIPYMLREGLITKDEAERELKRAETNEFYKVLKEKLGQTPVQESALPDGVFLRPATLKDVPTMRDWQLKSINARLRKRPDMIEYMEKDARESVPDTKMIMSGDRTIGMLQCCWIDDGEWWYIGEIYLITEFRGRGIGSTLLLNEISEHDKLRLQVATDNPRAKALYESLGFKTVRTNQDMEVMDLVKTPESVCENMVDQLKSFKYGLGSNGSVHSASAHEYDTKYKLQSPEEFEQNGGGICYDYVEFMEGYLNAYGYDCKKYYISTNTADNDTHTFLLVRDGKGWKDGFIYPESSFKLMEGVYEVKNYEEAVLKIMDKIFDVNHNGEKYDEIKYYVWEYSGHPPYGSDMKTCMEYFSKGDPIHEGTAMKIKRKD